MLIISALILLIAFLFGKVTVKEIKKKEKKRTERYRGDSTGEQEGTIKEGEEGKDKDRGDGKEDC